MTSHRTSATNPQGHTQDSATVATTEERGRPCSPTTEHRRAQGHAPAGHPPYLLGDRVRHHVYGGGFVTAPAEYDERWPCWWVPVTFRHGTSRVMHRVLEPIT